MDWGKGKNILIAIFLIADLILGAGLLSARRGETAARQRQLQSAVEYLTERGVSVDAEIPDARSGGNVLTVSFAASGGEKAVLAAPGGMPLIIYGADPSDVEGVSKGARIKVQPPASALISAAKELEPGDSVKGVMLVYMVDRSAYDLQAGEDTALPFWELSCDSGTYYYPAYSQ
jgi:hypothetical protein